MADYLVYGAGGFAREVAWLAETCGHVVVGFIDDEPHDAGTRLNGIPVLTLEDAASQFSAALIVSGVGSPKARENTIVRAVRAGLRPGTLIHPRAEMSRWVDVGPGSVICAGNILTTNVTLGRHVQINLDCTIGHDVVMEDFATLAPGVHVSGWVHVGRGAYVGTGVNIINGTKAHPLVIGAEAVIGAGACVTRSIPPGVIAVGVPAKPRTQT